MSAAVPEARAEVERRERIEYGLEDHWGDPFDGDPQPRHVAPVPDDDPDPLPARGRPCGHRDPKPGGITGWVYCNRPTSGGVCPVHGRQT